ncbi:MAG TPA: hypothetical protein VIT20_04295 [Propionibacteriaceae bacterium]
MRTGPLVCGLVLLATLVWGSQLSVGLVVRDAYDRTRQVSAGRLDAALLTFRPPGRPGGTRPLDPADLAPDRAVRTEPRACSPLTLLAQDAPAGRFPLDGASWTGAQGSPAQPVTLLVVRYADADAARGSLNAKRTALWRCRQVQLTFPPFTEPAQSFTVHGAAAGLVTRTDRLTYRLDGPAASYVFYVRRYANTVIWSYADDVSTPAVRRFVVDSLATRLRDIARER